MFKFYKINVNIILNVLLTAFVAHQYTCNFGLTTYKSDNNIGSICVFWFYRNAYAQRNTMLA